MTSIAEQDSTTHFWRILRGYIEQAFALFGSPTQIARRFWLNAQDYALTRDWLRVCEALLRRLLLSQAQTLELAPLPAREHKNRDRTRARTSIGAAFNLDDSATWAASFRLDAPRFKRPRCAKPRAPRLINIFAAAPLALRLEALVRGFNNPAPLAQRLARTLQRRAFTLAPVRKRDAAKPGFSSVIEFDDAFASFQPPHPQPDSS